MNDEIKKKVLQLRMVVGFLGERAQYNWWPTAFFESSSHIFLKPIYTKTSILAQYHGVVEAARRLHDEHLNVGSYNLFRLPEEIEHSLHILVSNNAQNNFTFHSLQSKANALEFLVSMAASHITTSEGPSLVSKIKDFDSTKALEKTAGTYITAFEQGVKVYPYFAR